MSQPDVRRTDDIREVIDLLWAIYRLLAAQATQDARAKEGGREQGERVGE